MTAACRARIRFMIFVDNAILINKSGKILLSRDTSRDKEAAYIKVK